MKIFFGLLKAHFKDITRDKTVIFWFFLFPLIIVLMYGAIFSEGSYGTMSSGSFDQTFNLSLSAPSTSTAAIIFENIPVFAITRVDKDLALQNLNDNNTDVAVIVEEDSGKEIVSVHYNSDQNSMGFFVANFIKQVLTEADLQMSNVTRRYEVKEIAKEIDSLRMIDYLLPGILAMALMQLGLFGSMRFVSSRERHITKRLAVAPISKASFLSSEVLLRLMMGLVQGVLILSLGFLIYKVPINGSLASIFGIIVLGSMVFISLGYFLCSFTHTSEAAMGVIQIIQFPMMFLSGIFFPMSFLPSSLRPIVKALPLTYLGDGMRQIILGVSGEFSMLTNVSVLMGWFVVTFFLAVKSFRWE